MDIFISNGIILCLNMIEIFSQFINNLCEAAAEDEEQAVSVEVNKERTKEEVVAKILEILD